MPSVSAERAFALFAVVVLLGTTLSALTVPTAAGADDSLAFEPGVPEEYAFDAPTETGTATVGGDSYESVQAAVDAATPGDTVHIRGSFSERVIISTPNITLESAPGRLARIDGDETEDALTIDADGVTVRRIWIHNSGRDTGSNDAGIWVNGTDARILDSRLTDVTFGIWVNGVDDVLLRNNTIVGREAVRPLSYRGNGIQLWKTTDTRVVENRITDVRDGLYYSWASNVTARENTMWELRYGVHYMYSDDCRLQNNTSFDNDVGYALMLSEHIEVVDNVAVNNTGVSGHGILLKRIDDSVVRGNHFVGNDRGIYVLNSVRNVMANNLVMENGIGVHLTAGTEDERVFGNSFVNNDRSVFAVTGELAVWNASERGNYWSSADAADIDNDGISDVRYRPSGLVEHLIYEHPQAAVFADSPAFDAIRLAESSFPVIESPGVVDHHPLTTPPHSDWRRYYERN
ncbi:nitrous oxidase accessory protein [Halogeometricum borinquense DSM 11551]|uniref:Nitrous oxidase accessory protein n=1 Tax=Halogeometricum borinquense (strain ATCC 700274 / DSM 11551 / JCM 10706 / KCTC 4070 / PR3) TaxID=469382 RepID=E4NU62_HALBP|nr:nitrous oxide reductase family maturation protein NosD [Halogeometricum borinquense]ADQ68582.1 nitrous oxidase accessory protein [Halogeometricum borinquense DSM 11551]ELY25547.1 nitrous oxidase accessory protein [Halogeometricum borinquense DSM 11551]